MIEALVCSGPLLCRHYEEEKNSNKIIIKIQWVSPKTNLEAPFRRLEQCTVKAFFVDVRTEYGVYSTILLFLVLPVPGTTTVLS